MHGQKKGLVWYPHIQLTMDTEHYGTSPSALNTCTWARPQPNVCTGLSLFNSLKWFIIFLYMILIWQKCVYEIRFSTLMKFCCHVLVSVLSKQKCKVQSCDDRLHIKVKLQERMWGLKKPQSLVLIFQSQEHKCTYKNKLPFCCCKCHLTRYSSSLYLCPFHHDFSSAFPQRIP